MAIDGQAARVHTLIVDDEPIACRRLASLLADEADIDVIGSAANGTEAVRAIATERPDLVFLDVQMPGLDGVEALRATSGIHQPLVVFITAHAIRETMSQSSASFRPIDSFESIAR